jgi:FtsP/CotA-like multicopper oxidase with cupredoxin domain
VTSQPPRSSNPNSAARATTSRTASPPGVLRRGSRESVTGAGWPLRGPSGGPDAARPNRIDANPALGATEEWTFTNRSGQDHPIHLHDINFQVVSGASTGPDTEWKETINVPSWSSVTLRVTFPDYTGVYMFHCHILEHEDNMLMGQFKVG